MQSCAEQGAKMKSDEIARALEAVSAALTGECGEDQERIARQGILWLDLLLRKNKDYGSSVWHRPICAQKIDAGSAILVRMSDKIHRIRSLSSGQHAEVKSESFDDTIRDLGAYCLLYLARPQNDE